MSESPISQNWRLALYSFNHAVSLYNTVYRRSVIQFSVKSNQWLIKFDSCRFLTWCSSHHICALSQICIGPDMPLNVAKMLNSNKQPKQTCRKLCEYNLIAVPNNIFYSCPYAHGGAPMCVQQHYALPELSVSRRYLYNTGAVPVPKWLYRCRHSRSW